uniref:Uncharacterized protein n=1 Tax=Micrurus spixii TaxID=129469 RepID=A0A2D4LAD5_9SAUR
MGKRRRRQHSEPESLSKPLKQQKMEDYIANRQSVPVSNSFTGTLPDKPNLCDPLEWNLQTELEDKQNVELSSSLSVGGPCSWSPAAAQGEDVANSKRENVIDFLSSQCLLTAQTVNIIYDLLTMVMNKVDCLGEFFASFVRSRAETVEGPRRIITMGRYGMADSANEAGEGPGFPPKNSNNYSLQTNQVTL